jgi:hypothetical protein
MHVIFGCCSEIKIIVLQKSVRFVCFLLDVQGYSPIDSAGPDMSGMGPDMTDRGIMILATIILLDVLKDSTGILNTV